MDLSLTAVPGRRVFTGSLYAAARQWNPCASRKSRTQAIASIGSGKTSFRASRRISSAKSPQLPHTVLQPVTADNWLKSRAPSWAASRMSLSVIPVQIQTYMGRGCAGVSRDRDTNENECQYRSWASGLASYCRIQSQSKRRMNVAPPSGRRTALNCAPCSRAIRVTMASPNPVPRGLVLR